MQFSTVRLPFALPQHCLVCREFWALQVNAGQTPVMRTIPVGDVVCVEDIEEDYVLFRHRENWHRCLVDEFSDCIQQGVHQQIGSLQLVNCWIHTYQGSTLR